MTKRDSARSASAAAAAQQAVDDKIVIAVDFGTTFSGVATVYSATPDEVDIIRTWPGIARLYHASKLCSIANSDIKVAMELLAIRSLRRYPTNWMPTPNHSQMSLRSRIQYQERVRRSDGDSCTSQMSFGSSA
jgi:hypothetical protein